MKDIDEVRERIQERKGFYSRVNQKDKKLSFFNFLYFITIFSLIVGGCYVGYLINEQKHFIDNERLVNTVQSKINEWNLDKFVGWLPFEGWFRGDSKAVSEIISYSPYQDDYFFSDSNRAISIADGIVIYCDEQESGKIVMIKQDNGVIATYGALQEIQCHENDRILKGTVLGTYEEAIFLQFHLNSNKITYEEAMALGN